MSWTRALLLLPVVACLPVAGDDWQLQEHIDDGAPCFAAGDSGVDVVVVLAECLSSSCSRDLVGSCEATVDGSTITLTSTITWEQNVGENVACTDDCGVPQANCTIEGLADGTYTVEYGAQTLDLTVPVAGTTSCGVL